MNYLINQEQNLFSKFCSLTKKKVKYISKNQPKRIQNFIKN